MVGVVMDIVFVDWGILNWELGVVCVRRGWELFILLFVVLLYFWGGYEGGL